VTAIVSAATDVERVRSLGADDVLVVPRGEEPGGLSGFAVVVDAVGDEVPRWMYQAAQPGGTLVTLQVPPDEQLAAELGIHTVFFVVTADAARLTELDALLAEGRLTADVAQTFPLAQGRDAFVAAGVAGRRHGKILLLPHPEG
jgi:NADPH:quinone reductase-like Zn-dependent oxidoreductase